MGGINKPGSMSPFHSSLLHQLLTANLQSLKAKGSQSGYATKSKRLPLQSKRRLVRMARKTQNGGQD
jgi:hypothetical protein